MRTDTPCAACGGTVEATDTPVDFKTKFRYYVITAKDPGGTAAADDTVHAATDDPTVAKFILNMLTADGVDASGWDNHERSWFVTPEIIDALSGTRPLSPQ
ncbi:MAG: hypothetical protein OXG35_12895 [Acidobacteria bacterium]|nr:hypothetical protein [Acidobacteriota bacterium]